MRKKREILAIAKKYKTILDDIFDEVEIRLFGSYYKGTANKWSDIDLAVISPNFKDIPYILSLKILHKLRLKVSDEIEALPMTREDLISPPLGSIEYEISKHSKRLL